MLTTILLCLCVAFFTFIATALSLASQLSKAETKIREARDHALRYQLAADYYEGECTTRYNNSLDSWQVIRGYDPYFVVIANYPCLNDEEEAKKLAEELSETINRLRSYAEE